MVRSVSTSTLSSCMIADECSASETCTLHQQTHEQMAEELEAVKALRVEAAATVTEAKLASVAAQAAASEVCLHHLTNSIYLPVLIPSSRRPDR